MYKTGAVFKENNKNSPSELAFKYAVHSVNKDKGLLPDTTLVYSMQYVPDGDSFHATKRGKFSSAHVLFYYYFSILWTIFKMYRVGEGWSGFGEICSVRELFKLGAVEGNSCLLLWNYL